MAGPGIHWTEDGIITWFDGPEWDEIAEEAFQDGATEIESAARYNAPWEDRTGDARAGLSTSVENENGVISLTLYHTAEYGKWLEVIQNGRFAIIMPTLEENALAIMSKAMDRITSSRSGID